MSAHAVSPEEISARKKKYINVFWGLVVLTAVELFIVQLGHWYPQYPKLLIDAGIVLFSASKAVVVGYYYMHLEHETKWLKFVACLPILAFMYAFFMVSDVKHDRHMSLYLNEPAREFPAEMVDRAKYSTHHEGGHEANVSNGEGGKESSDSGVVLKSGEAKENFIEYNEKSGPSDTKAKAKEAGKTGESPSAPSK